MPTKKLSGNTYMDAFNRVKPLLDQLRNDVKKAATAVAKEYDGLPKLDKAKFADKITKQYGWSQRRLENFAKVGREFPGKAKVISCAAPRTKFENLTTEHMDEIVRTNDSLIEKAAKAGVFDEDQLGRKVSTRDLRDMRNTGKLPTPKIEKPTTDLDKIRKQMQVAESHIEKASLAIGKITSIMEDSSIVDAKGKEATALIKAFERLCVKMASANPETSKRAFAILKGEA